MGKKKLEYFSYILCVEINYRFANLFCSAIIKLMAQIEENFFRLFANVSLVFSVPVGLQ